MADTECDRCGAMLPLPDSTGYSTCLSCGSATRLEVRDHAADTASRRRAEEAEDARRAGETWVPPATARGLPPDPDDATTVSTWSSSGSQTTTTDTSKVTTVRSEKRGCGFGLGAVIG
ncbi:MAG TPA: hypothetical protein VHK88_19695, partial [Aquihabitans sp.]|nr:hypothetical protein [Aquihabitans sp.]